MNRIIASAATAAVLSLIAGSAFAQVAGDLSTANGTANTTIIQSIKLTPGASLSFGTVVKPSTGAGTVVITPAGVRTPGGGAVIAPGSAGATAASFTVTGDASRSFSITTPVDSTLTNQAAAGGTIALTAITTSAGTGTTDTSGNASFTVGGTINISAATNPGTYSGTFAETVQYN